MDVAILQLIGQAGDGSNAAISMGGGDQIVQPRLIYRRAPFLQCRDLGIADIDLDNLVPLAGDAASGGGADVAQSENGDFHNYSSIGSDLG